MSRLLVKYKGTMELYAVHDGTSIIRYEFWWDGQRMSRIYNKAEALQVFDDFTQD